MRLAERLIRAELEEQSARHYYEEECSCEVERCRHWKDWIAKLAIASELRARFDAGER